MDLVSLRIRPVASPAASAELLGETLPGVFGSCTAAPLPHTAIPPTDRTLSSYRMLWEPCRWEAAPANYICFSVITLQSIKEEQFPYLCMGFQMKARASN